MSLSEAPQAEHSFEEGSAPANSDRLSLTGRKWVYPEAESLSEPWWESLLVRRGIVSSQREAFLNPSLQALPDPALLAGIEQALLRLEHAITQNESVVVYGDYDVDGVTSTSVLVEGLRAMGASIDYYIPERQREGYGLNEEAVAKLAQKHTLMLTTDCGSTSHQEIASAQRQGMDTIVVDHHQVGETLPDAIAVINPQRSDCAYPFKGLCAAGVAFMLVGALRRHLRQRGFFGAKAEYDLRESLDIVALATVADMVPLVGPNRILVAAGLKRLQQSPRPGLLAMLEQAKVRDTHSSLRADTLGFVLGPRLNARGRLEHAGLGVELLLCTSHTQALDYASSLEHANQQRRTLEQAVFEQAEAQVAADNMHTQPAIVIEDRTWHPGVLGLVASRLSRRFHRPAIVIGQQGKGSGRSISGLNLYRCMQQGAQFCQKFGGHPAAAGLTLKPGQVEAYRAAIQKAVIEQIGEPPYADHIQIDAALQPAQISIDTIAHLEKMEPFGQHNPAPVFLSRRLPIIEKRIVGQNHLSLRFKPEQGPPLRGIFFRQAHLKEHLSKHVDVLYALKRDGYRGGDHVQLLIEDIAIAQS